LHEERFQKICKDFGIDLKSLEEKHLKEKEKKISVSEKESEK
jgi:hypothetical protein